MNRSLLLWLLAWVLSHSDGQVVAQPLPNRYLEEIFTNADLQIINNVVFSTNIPHVAVTNFFGIQLANEERYGDLTNPPGQTVTLRMNIYMPHPDVDTLSKRPVIIFSFGGGFVQGSRTEASMLRLCEAFARRGFVTATMDYRLGMNLSNPELSKRAVYRGLQDGRSAVRFFRNNAEAYRVDPNQIYIGGYSAGAFIALHNIYLDRDEERPESTRDYLGRPDLGGLDDIGDNRFDADGNPVSGKANAAISFAGALGELFFIEGPDDEPVVLFHSSDDNTVPFNVGVPFSFLSWVPGINLPTVYGSNAIQQHATSVEAPHRFFGYTNRGHSVHFNSPNLYPDIAPRGSQFFYDYRLKPNEVSIEGAAVVCSYDLTQVYTLSHDDNFYYDWQVEGGTIQTSNAQYSASVVVVWDASATEHRIQCTPYSQWLARAEDPVVLTVHINEPPMLVQPFPELLYQLSDGSASIDLSAYLSDPEQEPLSYVVNVADESVLEASVLGDILEMSFVEGGNTQLNLEVTDASGCVMSWTLDVSVNRAPQPLMAIDDQQLRYGHAPFVIDDLAALFTDADDDPLVFSVDANPAEIVDVLHTGNQLTLVAQEIGETVVSLTAEDGRGGSSTLTFTVSVLRGEQQIVFEDIGQKFVDESPVMLVASSDRQLPVMFELLSGEAEIIDEQLFFEQAGILVIRAYQPGDAYFEPAEAQQTVSVVRRSQSIEFADIGERLISETGLQLQASASSGLPVVFSITEGAARIEDNRIWFDATGWVGVRASQPGNNVYEPAEPVEQQFYVASEELQMAFAPNPFEQDLFVTLSGAYKGRVELMVYDTVGRLVQRIDVQKNNYLAQYRLPGAQWVNGVYILRVHTSEKNVITKVIKQ